MRALSLSLGLFTSVALARILGPEDYGSYVLLLTLLSVLSLPAGSAFNQFVMRETSRLIEASRITDLAGFRRRSLQWIFFVSGLAMICAVLSSGSAPFFLPTSSLTTAVLLLIPLLALNTFYSESLRGAGDLVASQWPEMILRPFIVLGLLTLLWTIDYRFSFQTPLFIQIASALVVMTVLARRDRETFKKIGVDNRQSFDDRRWLEELPWFFLLTAIWSFSQQVGVLMAGLSTDGASQVSALQLALSASMLIALPLVVITTITGPELARLNRNGPNISSLAPSIKATRLAASVSFIVLMPVMLFAEQIIELVYGREFMFAANPIRVLCVAQFVNVCFGLTGQLLISSGLERATVKAQLSGLIVTIVFGLSMVRSFGSLGVAFAMLLGMLTWNFMLARWVSRHFGIGRLLRADIPEGCK